MAMHAYAADLRDRVVAARLRGEGTRSVAARFEVSESWVRRLMQRHRGGLGTAPLRRVTPGRRPKLAGREDELREDVRSYPDSTLAEIRRRLGLGVAISTLAAFLDRLGLTVKKKLGCRPSGRGPTWSRGARGTSGR